MDEGRRRVDCNRLVAEVAASKASRKAQKSWRQRLAALAAQQILCSRRKGYFGSLVLRATLKVLRCAAASRNVHDLAYFANTKFAVGPLR